MGFPGSHHPALIQGAMPSGDRWERFSAVTGGDGKVTKFFPTRSESWHFMIDELVIHGWSFMCHNGFSISFCLSFLSMLLNVKTSSGASSCTESHDSPETHIFPAGLQVDRFGQAICEAFIANRRLTNCCEKWIKWISSSRNCMHNICKICLHYT